MWQGIVLLPVFQAPPTVVSSFDVVDLAAALLLVSVAWLGIVTACWAGHFATRARLLVAALSGAWCVPLIVAVRFVLSSFDLYYTQNMIYATGRLPGQIIAEYGQGLRWGAGASLLLACSILYWSLEALGFWSLDEHECRATT
jgi:hypothetical protein